MGSGGSEGRRGRRGRGERGGRGGRGGREGRMEREKVLLTKKCEIARKKLGLGGRKSSKGREEGGRVEEREMRKGDLTGERER